MANQLREVGRVTSERKERVKKKKKKNEKFMKDPITRIKILI